MRKELRTRPMKKFDIKKIASLLRSKLFENFRIKLICFLLAVAMFFSISIFQRNTKTFSADLRIVGLKDYFVIANELPDIVKIIAKDKKDVFDKLTDVDFNVRLDLSDAKATGKYKIRLAWDIPKTMNSFFSNIRIEPDELEVDIDRLSEKNVDITINTIGEPMIGYIVKKMVVNPPSIRIEGPENIIRGIGSVKTETINIEGIKDSFGRQVDLVPGHNSVKVLGKADIYFEIIPETDLLTFKYKDVIFQNLRQEFSASTRGEVTVILKGPKTEAVDISQNDIYLIIDCSNINGTGEFQQSIEVRKPKNFELVSVNPEKIRVYVEKK
jgi:YbbR domain-containing protein